MTALLSDHSSASSKTAFDVLVVEDNPGDAFLLREALRTVGDAWSFDVTVVETLAGALGHLAACRPDVVMLDLQLPDARSLDGLVRIRTTAPDVPVVVLTGNRDTGLGAHAVLAGAQDYVRKGDATGPHIARVLAYAVHRRAATAAVRAAEERLGSLLQAVNDIVALHAADGSLRYASPSAARLLGLAAGEPVRHDDVQRRIHPDDRDRVDEAFACWLAGGNDPVQFRLLTATGDWLHCEAVGSNRLEDPAVEGVVVTTRDISDRKRAEAELAYQAVHDGMTGLPNRTLFFDRLDHALARRARTGSCVAVLFVDLDHLKVVNDSRGHKVGDEVLMAVARTLTDTVRPGDTVARLSGDEFAVLCEDVEGPEGARDTSERLLRAVCGVRTVLGKPVHVSVSIGVAVATTPEATADALLRDADAALYRAKEHGRGRVEVFDDDLRAAADRRTELEQALATAVARGAMRVHYQPQVEIGTGRLVGFEALLRWTHPVLGEIPPGEFVVLAEQSGLIGGLGAWVLEQACLQLAAFRRRHPDVPVEIAVNISGRQLSDPKLLSDLRHVLEETGVEPGRLCLEITESVVMEDAAASVATLRSLRALGVRLAIDDFGTGYSSLAYLKRFPVDVLKVDRAFVSGLGRDPEDSVIVASIAQLASSLGVDVLAEGVETAEQLQEVAALGCRYGQGYLWGKPMPASELDEVFEASRKGTIARPATGAVRPEGDGDAAVGDVVSVLTHELRTPITVIRGFAETLAELLVSGRTEVLESAIDAINRQTHGMESMLESLAELRAVEDGTLCLDRRVVLVDDLVSEIVGELAMAVPAHVLELEGRAGSLVPLDATRLRQILGNLVTNSAKWSPAGSVITVQLDVEDATAVVRVIDRGPGVPADRAGEIFRKFSRLDCSRKGTGLGLFLARAFARAHGGDLYYRRAALTGGAEFVVLLPIAGASTEAPLAPAVDVTPPPAVPSPVLADGEGIAALHEATRALLRVEVPEEAVGIAIGLARRLGGEVVLGSREPDPRLVPVDLSFGIGEPVHPAAECGTIARLRLEELFVPFLEDADRVLRDLSAGGRPNRSPVDPVTGFPGRVAVLEAMAAGPGSTLLVAVGGTGPAKAELMRRLARVLHVVAQPGDAAGQWGRRVLALYRPGDDSLHGTADSLRRIWSELDPHGPDVGTAVTCESDNGRALATAERTAVRAAGLSVGS
ncbi:MAG TPA: EAL domain-containing protein [Acidimicrobiales bacterium]|nr:EAL domain-containing protein [Acidimicrobiales bacterium]